MSTGRRRFGRSSNLSSSAIESVYGARRANGIGGRRMTVTSATAQAQTAPASATWTRTSHHGRCVRYWSSPTPICTRNRNSSAAAPSAYSGHCCAVPPDEDEEGDEERAEDRRRAHVHVERSVQAPEPLDVRAARVRAGGRRDGAGDDETRAALRPRRARRGGSGAATENPFGRARATPPRPRRRLPPRARAARARSASSRETGSAPSRR